MRLTRSFLVDALSPYALTAALTTAETFDEGYDRGVGFNAAPDKLRFGEITDVPAA